MLLLLLVFLAGFRVNGDDNSVCSISSLQKSVAGLASDLSTPFIYAHHVADFLGRQLVRFAESDDRDLLFLGASAFEDLDSHIFNGTAFAPSRALVDRSVTRLSELYFPPWSSSSAINMTCAQRLSLGDSNFLQR